MGRGNLKLNRDSINWYEYISDKLSILIIFLGIIFFLGWLLNINVLISPNSTFSSIKTNAVLGILLIGVSLWLLQRKRINKQNRRIAQILSFLAVLIGLLTFFEYAANINLGIDQFLFQDVSGAIYTSSPNRMAFTAAICLILAGIANISLDLEIKDKFRISQYISLIVALISFLALVGFSYNVLWLYYVSSSTGMAIYAAITFLMISLATLCARPDKGSMNTYTADKIGSRLLTRFLLPAIILIIIIGRIFLEGVNMGLYSANYNAAITVVFSVVVLYIMIWKIAIELNKIDLQREIAIKELIDARNNLDIKVKERTAELILLNKELKDEISAHKKSQKTLSYSEERFKMLFEGSHAPMLLINPDNGEIIEANLAASKFYGYDLKTIRSMNIGEINQLSDKEIFEARKMARKKGRYFVFPHKLAGGEIRTVEIFSSPIQYGERIILFSIINDITEREVADKALKESLKEKETLIREIHHRVKNNMQIISSLLNLQIQSEEQDEIIGVLQESQGRIKSMAIVHEKLYQSDSLSNINLKDYFSSLVSSILRTYGKGDRHISWEVKVGVVYLGIDTVIPLGLIINELVTNSVKYAFPNNKKGKIMIKLEIEGDLYVLTVSDDGVGIPENIKPENTDTLGLQLVISLIDQIDGEYDLNQTKGTEYIIKFKEILYKKRI
jgi:PAS domain S-box-containing protein